MMTVYKVLTAEQFAALQAGRFSGAPVDVADGYIHLSTAAQLTGTVQKHFSGQEGLVIAAVDSAALGAGLRSGSFARRRRIPAFLRAPEHGACHCPRAFGLGRWAGEAALRSSNTKPR